MNRKTGIILMILALSLTLFVGCQEKSGENIVVGTKIIDMAGREVELPNKVETVFSVDPVGTIYLYTLSPEKMVGWNYTLRDGEKRYIDEKYYNLPNLGGAGKEVINLEEILKIKPDLLIFVGRTDEGNISEIEKMEEQLGQSIVMIDYDMEKLDDAYKLLGQILNVEEKAEELAKYCKDTLEYIEKNREKIKEEEQVSIYYAEGPEGLQSEPAGTSHVRTIEMVGGYNVIRAGEDSYGGKMEVSMEQVYNWNPEIIISWDDERGGYFSGILEDPLWKDIKAVKDREVYEIPNKPFNWLDRPSSVNRILGVKWLGNLLYPEVYDLDIREEVREFYSKFYHYELTDTELDELLKNTVRHP